MDSNPLYTPLYITPVLSNAPERNNELPTKIWPIKDKGVSTVSLNFHWIGAWLEHNGLLSSVRSVGESQVKLRWKVLELLILPRERNLHV